MVARRHHFVPKCYLEAFATKSDKKKNSELQVFDSVEKKTFPAAPHNVALETDFNTIDLEGHEPDAFEKAMASVESDLGPALARIIEAKSLANADDRNHLLNLIGLLHVRNPRTRERNRGFRDHAAKVILDVVMSTPEMWNAQVKKAQEAGFIPKDAETDYEKLTADYKPEDYRIELPNEEQILSEMQMFDHVLPLLSERKWVLVKAPANSKGFVTCDHPVSLVWSEPNTGPMGLKTRGTEIFFPISPDLAVVGAYELENAEADFTGEEVASANGTTILNARRQVYSRDNDFTYQIDQTAPPMKAAGLIADQHFKPHPNG